MPKCEFTSQYNYYDYEIREWVNFYCKEIPLASGRCIFHDNDYLQDKTNNEEHKTKVLDRLTDRVNHAIANNEPLLCIGFQLADFSLSDLNISKEFTNPVYFSGSQFVGEADFSAANFQGESHTSLMLNSKEKEKEKHHSMKLHSEKHISIIRNLKKLNLSEQSS